jgi:hypothetical protein
VLLSCLDGGCAYPDGDCACPDGGWQPPAAHPFGRSSPCQLWDDDLSGVSLHPGARRSHGSVSSSSRLVALPTSLRLGCSHMDPQWRRLVYVPSTTRRHHAGGSMVHATLGVLRPRRHGGGSEVVEPKGAWVADGVRAGTGRAQRGGRRGARPPSLHRARRNPRSDRAGGVMNLARTGAGRAHGGHRCGARRPSWHRARRRPCGLWCCSRPSSTRRGHADCSRRSQRGGRASREHRGGRTPTVVESARRDPPPPRA